MREARLKRPHTVRFPSFDFLKKKKKSATIGSENRSIAVWDRGWGEGINHIGAPGNFGMIELLSILIFDISWAKVLTTSKKGEFHWM